MKHPIINEIILSIQKQAQENAIKSIGESSYGYEYGYAIERIKDIFSELQLTSEQVKFLQEQI